MHHESKQWIQSDLGRETTGREEVLDFRLAFYPINSTLPGFFVHFHTPTLLKHTLTERKGCIALGSAPYFLSSSKNINIFFILHNWFAG